MPKLIIKKTQAQAEQTKIKKPTLIIKKFPCSGYGVLEDGESVGGGCGCGYKSFITKECDGFARAIKNKEWFCEDCCSNWDEDLEYQGY